MIFLASMVIVLGDRHRLVADEKVDLLYGDAEVKHSCDEGIAGQMGRTQLIRYKVACQRLTL